MKADHGLTIAGALLVGIGLFTLIAVLWAQGGL